MKLYILRIRDLAPLHMWRLCALEKPVRTTAFSLLLLLFGCVPTSVLQESLAVWFHWPLLCIWLNGQVSFPQCNSDCSIYQLQCSWVLTPMSSDAFPRLPPQPTCSLPFPHLVQQIGHFYLPSWRNPNPQAKSESTLSPTLSGVS